MSSRPTYVVLTQELVFFWAFILVIFSWVLIDLWGRWINNFTFEYLGLNSKSSYHTFIIALAMTCILVVCFIFFRSLGYNFTAQVTGGVMTSEVDISSEARLPDPGDHDAKGDFISGIQPVDFIEMLTFPSEI